MATDATGTPTSPDNIPKYNTSVDAPSGLGFNAAMDQIQVALNSRPSTPAGIVTGEAMIWNGTTWVRSSVTKLSLSSITDPGAGKVIGSASGAAAAVVPPGTTMAQVQVSGTGSATGVTAYTSGGDALNTFPSATYAPGRYFAELFIAGLQVSPAAARLYFGIYRNDNTTALAGWQGILAHTPSIMLGTYCVRMFFDVATEFTETLKLRYGSDGSGNTYHMGNGGGEYIYIAQVKKG